MTYNREDRIYEYMDRVLESLKKHCSKIYLVCNYEKRVPDFKSLSCVDAIWYRPNTGYDSGAYRDVLCDYLGWDEVCRYEELLLINDSFFGFFYPLEDTFNLMDNVDCDFWGMTGQGIGEYRNPDYSFEAHIHSYFLAFKKTVLRSPCFKLFWEDFSYPQNFREAIINFELGINSYLREHEFHGCSFVDIHNLVLQRNENPCYSRLYELVHDYKVPVMKKKCVLIRNAGFADTLKTIEYLRAENRYPTEWITFFLENQFYIPGMGESPCNSLEIFYRNHSEIYIYGAGVCGRNMAVYFGYKGWDFKGFLVTDSSPSDIHAEKIREAEIHEDTGIIVAVVSEKAAREIAENIGNRCTKDQLFFLSDCSAVRMPE